MDIEEFEKKVKPSGRRSRLEPFRAQIFELAAKGYAHGQVRDWLAANGLKVSRQAVQQFIKRRGGTAGAAVENGLHKPKKQVERSEEIGLHDPKPETAVQPAAPSHRPTDLNKIMSAKVDLDALSKFAKGMKK